MSKRSPDMNGLLHSCPEFTLQRRILELIFDNFKNDLGICMDSYIISRSNTL